jgi:acyl-coenzyme A thioesterase PaaI-like protein
MRVDGLEWRVEGLFTPPVHPHGGTNTGGRQEKGPKKGRWTLSEVMTRGSSRLLPNSDRHNCFGCSPKNPCGLKMEFYVNQDSSVVASWLSAPDHVSGWGNIVHGGIVSTILDEAMGWAALVILRKLVLSKSLSVEFKKPMFLNTETRVEGSVLESKNDREAIMQATIYDGNNEVCARSTSEVSLFTIDHIRKLGVVDNEMIDGLEEMMKLWE